MSEEEILTDESELTEEPQAAEESEESAESPANNIIYVGKRLRVNKQTGKRELMPITVPEFVIDAGRKILLPEGIENGAYMENAADLIALFPGDLKPITKKGK